MSTIYIAEPGKEGEARDEQDLRQAWQQGELAPTLLYWKEGMAEWQPLAGYFGVPPATPPPAPMGAVTSTTQTSAHPTHKTYSFTKDPTGLTGFILVVFWLRIICEFAIQGAEFYGYSVVVREHTDEELAFYDTLVTWISLTGVALIVVGLVALLKWMYRANLNVRGFGARGLEYSPGWCVGAFLVPIMNLLWPFQAMQEIWKASGNPAEWKKADNSSQVSVWWGLWLVSYLINLVYSRYADQVETIEAYQVVLGLGVLSAVMNTVVLLVTVRLLYRVVDRQTALVEGRSGNEA